MNFLKSIVVLIVFYFSSVAVMAQVVWDFEEGEDHGFELWCITPATPAADDPDVAGDESITGVGGADGLPAAGVAWTIGVPDEFDFQEPAVVEGCHVNASGLLEYGPCNDPYGVTGAGGPPYDFTNERGQSSYLNTYNLSQWGDDLHTAANDQIATSPEVVLGANAVLTVWSYAGGSGTAAPEPEGDYASIGYWDGSSGIAVLSAADKSFLASVLCSSGGTLTEFTLDLSAYSGQTVVVEVVDAFSGSWGWLAVDEIQITNAEVTDITNEPGTTSMTYALMQNYPNPFNPSTNISFVLAKNNHTLIKVYNTLGQEVATLVDENLNAGPHTITFNADNLESGVYFYNIVSGDYQASKKMMLIK